MEEVILNETEAVWFDPFDLIVSSDHVIVLFSNNCIHAWCC